MKKNIFLLTLLCSGFAAAQVGIKMPDPKANLDIIGTSFGIRNTAGWDNLWFTVNARGPSINASGAEDGLQLNVGTNTTGTYGDGQTLTTVATLRQNGNLGIGTTTPQNRLDLGGSNGGTSLTAAVGKKLAIYNNPSGTSFYGLGISTGYLQFHAGAAATAAPGMVLTTGGNVGVGTTTNAPGQRLTVVDAVNTNALNGIASFLDLNLTQGVGIGWNGIQGIGTADNVNLNLNGKGTGNILLRTDGTGRVGIGTAAPNASALLDVASTTQGFLPPRMTRDQRNAMSARPAGSIIYNTSTNCMQYWSGTEWRDNCIGTIATLACATAVHNGTLTGGTAASGVSSVISYTGGNEGIHSGQTVGSTGVAGLTATLAAGRFANGNGTLTYTITGTPATSGTASFAINIGGRTCTLTRNVTAPVGAIATLNCAAATNNGTLTGGTAASGVSSVIPYTGGNGGTHGGQVVASTGVTGLTATLTAGTFANGPGNLTYTITGTPLISGTASFAINIGGRTCILTRTVVGAATPPAPDLTAACTGWAVPYRDTGNSVSTTVNGQPLTATFNGGWSNAYVTGTPGQTLCGITTTNGAAFTYRGSQGLVRINFNRLVSNLKVNHITVNNNGAHDIITFVFKRNGVVVNTVTRRTIGTCGTLNSYTWTATGYRISRNASDGYNYAGTNYNFGGAWFDQVEISASNASGLPNHPFSSELSLCVGSVQ